MKKIGIVGGISWLSTVDYYSEICRRSEQAGLSPPLRRLEASGSEFALLAANTPHHRLVSIARGMGIPVVSILDAAARACAWIGASQVLILGTALTMSSQVFRDAFAKYGTEADGPDDESARQTTLALIRDLQRGSAPGAAERLGCIAKVACRQGVAAGVSGSEDAAEF